MSNKKHYTNCPVCSSTEISFYQLVKDNSVSQEEFEIWHCEQCSLRFTQDIPDEVSISSYYQSEDYISHSDTGKGIINRLYHLIRRRTLVSKRKLVQRFSGREKGTLLDLGCGTGAFLNEMKQAEWSITGIEPDASARMIAEKKYQISIKEPEAFYNLKHESYDAITMWHVLEHVHNLHGYMKHLKSILKQDGKLFIAVPNYTSYDASVYKQFWAAYDVPRHLYHFSPESMKKLAAIYGLKIETIKPMWYDSYYVSLLSSKYKNKSALDSIGEGAPNYFGAGLKGFISNCKALFDIRKCSSLIYIISK